MRPATACGASIAAFSSRTANSSPPSRAAVSTGRRVPPSRCADGHQQLVARPVPQAVVDRLEVVEIQEQDGQRRLAQPAGAIERVLDPIGEERPVGEPGQRIVQRLVAQLCLELLAGRDVVDEGVETDRSTALRRPDRELHRELVAVAMDRIQLHPSRQDASLARLGVPAQSLAVGCTLLLRDDELRQLDADRLGTRPSEGHLCLVVPVLDRPGAIDGHEGIARRLDDHALLLLAGDQRLLRELGGRDVDQQPLEHGMPIWPIGHRGVVEHPDDLVVPGDQAVFEPLRHAGFGGRRVRDKYCIPIVGVDAACPELRVRHPFLGGVPQHGFQLRAHEVPAPGRSRLGHVDDAGLALDQ